MKILITGNAGFIGFHLGNYLAGLGHEIIGIDNLNSYYDVNLKYSRLKEAGFSTKDIKEKHKISSKVYPNYSFTKMDMSDKSSLKSLFDKENFDVVCNLAAQAGVRYSLESPEEYLTANVDSFLNILECCRYNSIKNLVYASSSSVYGLNEKLPFSTNHNVDHPISLYAATKKTNELMAHTYSHLFNIPSTGLRFFTVYGPWGRPDMALFKFTKAAINGDTIDVYNNGEMFRDFTYVDDIVSGIASVIFNPPESNKNWDGMMPNPSSSSAPYKIYNIGNNNPIKLTDFIEIIEDYLKIKVNKSFKPLQPGDVVSTFAEIDGLKTDFNFEPKTSVKDGVINFLDWYTSFYK
jgi:UDP-glucuronate 4-epimerase